MQETRPRVRDGEKGARTVPISRTRLDLPGEPSRLSPSLAVPNDGCGRHSGPTECAAGRSAFLSTTSPGHSSAPWRSTMYLLSAPSSIR